MNFKEPAYYGRIGNLVDWIYKYVDQNETCKIVGEGDRNGSNDNVFKLSLNESLMSFFINELGFTFDDSHIFGIVVGSLIALFALSLAMGLFLTKRYIRIHGFEK